MFFVKSDERDIYTYLSGTKETDNVLEQLTVLKMFPLFYKNMNTIE